MKTPALPQRYGTDAVWVAAVCPHCDKDEQGWVRTPDPAGRPDWSRCRACNDPSTFEPRA